MDNSHVSLRCSQLVAAAFLSAALALNLVTPAPVQIGKQIQTHLVQLQAATASAVTNSSALNAASGNASTIGSNSTGYQANPSAAATTDGSFWSTPLGTVLMLADIATLPIWFLFTPITLPLSMLVAASQTDTKSSFSTLQFLILTAFGFLTGPLGLASLLIKPSSTTAAALSSRTTGSAPLAAVTEATATQISPIFDSSPTSLAVKSNAAAAATDDFVVDTLTTVGRAIATVAGWALAPLWYAAFPITTTIWDIGVSRLFPNFPRLQGIPFFAMFPSSWFVPFQLADILLPVDTSPKAGPWTGAAMPTASREAATGEQAAPTDAPTAPTRRRGKAVRGSTPQPTSKTTANSMRSASAAGAAQSSDSPMPASARRTPLAAHGTHR